MGTDQYVLHQHSTDCKFTASLCELSLNSQDIFKPAGSSVAKNLYSHLLSTHHPQLGLERMFPHTLRHNKASGKMLPPKGKDVSTHPKWNKMRDVFLWMCEGCMRRFGGCKAGERENRSLKHNGKREGRLVCAWGEVRRACWHFCVCARPCVCERVRWEAVECFTYCRNSLKARTSTQENTDTRRGAIFKAHLSTLCQFASFKTETPPPWYRHKHTQWHTQSSSVSNESPEDLSDNNSTQICFFF